MSQPSSITIEPGHVDALRVLEEIDAAQTCEQAFNVFLAYAKSLGAHDIMVGQIAGLNHDIPDFESLLYLSNEEMLGWWFEAGLNRNDPVIARALRSSTPFAWDQAFIDAQPNAPSFGYYTEVLQTTNGLEIPIHTPYRPAGGVSLLLEPDTLSTIERHTAHLVSLHLFNRFEELGTGTHLSLRDKLSVRECDILTYAAIGKTDQETAEKIGISINTVRFHFKSILRKLNASNRAHAVSIGIRIGVIIP